MEEPTVKEKKCIRYLTKEMSPEDRLVFEIELSIDDELRQLYIHYRKIWYFYPSDKAGINHELAKQRIQKRIKDKFSNQRKYVYAAVLIIFILVGASAIFFTGSLNYTNIKTAAKGEREEFFLPDSSLVILNSGSQLKYKENFSNPREVWLEGEAFFDVKKNKENPFLVHTNDIDVRVKGTSFGVNATEEKQTISLATGKVNVLLKTTEDEVNLLPNEQLTWNSQTNEIIKRNFDPEKVLAWKEDILLLDNIPFSKAVHKINEFYGVHFNISGDQIKDQRIKGAFKNQNLKEFIASLEFITNVKVVQKTSQEFIIKASNEN